MPWTEADEVAANMSADLLTIYTLDDAFRHVPPADEVGYQVRDNMAKALLNRARAFRALLRIRRSGENDEVSDESAATQEAKMSDFDLLRSPTAIVSHRQVHGEMGGATVHCVVLADGFIVDCGSDGYALDRARFLAMAVNEFGPECFTRDGLEVATREDRHAK